MTDSREPQSPKLSVDLALYLRFRAARLTFADPKRQADRRDVITAVLANPNTFLDQYRAAPRSRGGHFINADLMKETFAPYRANPAARSWLDAPLGTPASILAAEQYRRVIRALDKTHPLDVIFLTGAPGAGKTSAVFTSNTFPSHVAAVYEGAFTLNTSRDIRLALSQRQRPIITVVHNTPEAALENSLGRHMAIGRGATLAGIATVMAELPRRVDALHRAFGDRLELHIIDKRDPLHVKEHRGWSSQDLLQSEGSYVELRQRAQRHLEHLRAQRLVPDSAYDYAHGRPTPPMVDPPRLHDRRLADELGPVHGITREDDPTGASRLLEMPVLTTHIPKTWPIPPGVELDREAQPLAGDPQQDPAKASEPRPLGPDTPQHDTHAPGDMTQTPMLTSQVPTTWPMPSGVHATHDPDPALQPTGDQAGATPRSARISPPNAKPDRGKHPRRGGPER